MPLNSAPVDPKKVLYLLNFCLKNVIFTYLCNLLKIKTWLLFYYYLDTWSHQKRLLEYIQ